MAALIYFTGPMNCGKSTLALQVDYTEASAGRRGLLFTCFDRGGEAVISSRIGLSARAIEVTPTFDFWGRVTDELTSGHRVDYLVCDEAQFYTEAQVNDLARIVDELGIDASCFGILTDFRTELFPGSRRLVELADRIEMLQARPRCWCGAPATHNARIVNGVMVVEGDQIAIGDMDAAAVVRYEVLCRRHHRLRMPSSVGGMDLTPDPLPFDDTQA
ncbi:MAG TPA: thymidine kinase [Propioniciclava sp.]|uniref:thymidine kinase n=1 Tax=Propioniciclava sp. TaxID=2038686 RepID=UPI002CB71117|nr:thymidine kinase [Propioniciclava sp.]HRL48129.1 thymidine kinase [Propioniciclava sp.]HRL79452.1 thymidine kinase [Propioniciclava sp.]